MNTKHALFSIGKLLLLSGILTMSPASDTAAQNAIPVRDQVGAQAMPAEIAPIEAPFDMPQLQRPQFADFSRFS